MKRYTRRKSYKVKILFSLLFLIILCMMAGKVLNSDLSFHAMPYHALPQYQPQQFNRCGSLV